VQWDKQEAQLLPSDHELAAHYSGGHWKWHHFDRTYRTSCEWSPVTIALSCIILTFQFENQMQPWSSGQGHSSSSYAWPIHWTRVTL